MWYIVNISPRLEKLNSCLADVCEGLPGKVKVTFLIVDTTDPIRCLTVKNNCLAPPIQKLMSLRKNAAGNWTPAELSGTIASKINVTPRGVYLPISKLHSIFAMANLLAHNNISQICYCSQISITECCSQLQFFWQSHTFGGNIYFAGYGTLTHYLPSSFLRDVWPNFWFQFMEGSLKNFLWASRLWFGRRK